MRGSAKRVGTAAELASARATAAGRTKVHRPVSRFAIVAVALVFGVLGLAPATAQSFDFSLITQFCEGHEQFKSFGAGQCESPLGVAVDQNSGDVYVADEANNRIQEFSPWGVPIRAWGWDVVASGPDDDVTPPEDQFEVCVPANGDVCKRGIEIGGGAGQIGSPYGVAVDSKGGVYAYDSGNHRIQKFSSQGDFQLAFGGDIVAQGPDDSTNDEVQEVSVAASGGTFKLGFEDPRNGDGKQETAALPYNASAVEVKAALDALATISGFGGSVGVSGGPGDAKGSTPYAVTFEGALGGDDVPKLSIDRSSLGPAAIGARLACSSDTGGEPKTVSFQWLRNGSPIGGATSPTYDTVAADEGKAIQCQVTASNANAGSIDVTNPPYVAPPVPGVAAPVSPSGVAGIPLTEPTTPIVVGGSGGQTLTCEHGTWVGAEAFSYAWYRNGVQIPAAAESTYVLTKADVATEALFQCAVTASNAGGTATTKSSSNRLGNLDVNTSPPPAPHAPEAVASMEPPGNVFTSQEGGAAEVCRPADTCKSGGTGHGDGQFGAAAPFGSFVAAGPGDRIYVGGRERIQTFDSEGAFKGSVPDPEGVLEDESVQSLAVDPVSGDIYFAFKSQSPNSGAFLIDDQPSVYRLDPTTGAVLGTLEVDRPSALTVDANGNVYAFDKPVFFNPGNPKTHEARIIEFKPDGDRTAILFENEFTNSTGIAATSACGIDGHDLFVANLQQTNTFIRLYGPPPDISICPPPKVPPTITAQHAVSVDSDGALVRAKINPRFWPDTRYYVEYGTGKCSEGGCEEKALFPGAQLGAGVVGGDVSTKAVFLGADAPLTPDATYHYRFVSESELSAAGLAIGEGAGQAERSFHTPPLPSQPKTDCPNQAFRTGASAPLPDCRAYELVSPLEKNNSDVEIPAEAHDLSATDGDSFTYGALAAAYADPLSAPLAPQYLSARDPETGWGTDSISPPRALPTLYNPPNSIDPEYRVFSEDLCSGWLIQYTDLALAPGAPPGVPNLYRRKNCGPEAGEYELVTTTAPTLPAPGFSSALEPGNSLYYLNPQGSSADGSMSVFRAPAKLTGDAVNKDLRQLYAESEGQLHAVSIPPKGKPLATHASVGTSQGGLGEFRGDSLYHAVSEDGSRVFWTAAATNSDPTRRNGGVGGVGDLPGFLYVRLNPTQPQSALDVSKKCTEPAKACTLEVSLPPTPSEGPEARFLTADRQGKFAVYIAHENLREVDIDKLIAGEPATTLIAPKVMNILGASEDAGRIYLVSTEALTGGQENSEGAKAAAGRPNLYLYERGAALTFIAPLSTEDVAGFGEENAFSTPSPIKRLPKRRSSRVSPDGLSAAFTSTASLTGYDNADQRSGLPDMEVYLYDANAGGGEGKLVCASCNPSGARPNGREIKDVQGNPMSMAASLPGWVDQLHPGNFLSNSGRLFFESADALLSRDTNGKQDVYEWEPAASEEECLGGIGGERYIAESGGCLSLISSGESGEDSYLADASADGRDVFFVTGSSLLDQDYGLRDVYDARVDGGFSPPPPPQPGCEGEACQGALSPPNDPTPASASFQGAGNVVEEAPAPAPCAKGKVRRKGRCVAKHHKRAHKRHRARRANANRGGAK